MHDETVQDLAVKAKMSKSACYARMRYHAVLCEYPRLLAYPSVKEIAVNDKSLMEYLKDKAFRAGAFPEPEFSDMTGEMIAQQLQEGAFPPLELSSMPLPRAHCIASAL